MKRLVILLATAAVVAILWRRGRPEEIHRLDGKAMGTTWTLAWRGGHADPDEVKADVAAVIEHLEQVASNWRENSDVSRCNRGEPPTPELAALIARADRFKEETEGAFDPRLLEKVHAAGFGPAGKGYDLSSMVEGLGSDYAVARIRAHGIRDFIFDLGGEVIAGDGEWPVAIEKPDPDSSTVLRVVMLKNKALSTSGNYRQFNSTKGGLHSHIIDPKTGDSILRPPGSVTVICDDCATADVWSTALFVLGPDYKPKGMEVSWQWGGEQ